MDAPPAATADQPRSGIALCLSGGGYRAMLFHLGVLWRLNEFGLLPRLSRISSVSGGAITAGVLALRWRKLEFDCANVATNFEQEIAQPIRKLAEHTIDVSAVLDGLFTPTSASESIAWAYREHLYGSATLQDLPETPRFVFNASNLQSGMLWRFSRPYMRDYRVGEVRWPKLALATAVAASSAFPPFLSPATLTLPEDVYTPGSGQDLQFPPYTTQPTLTDGGVYDNLGLQTASSFATLLVSDGGAKIAAEPDPKRDWLRQIFRVLDIVDNQVRSRRKLELIQWFTSGRKTGAYWGIRTDIGKYQTPGALHCPLPITRQLAAIATRLARMDEAQACQLVNWGHAVCDAGVRRYFDPTLPTPVGFIYPRFPL